MQIVSIGDNLHELPKPIFWEKIRKNIVNLSAAKFAQRAIKVTNKLISSFGDTLTFFFILSSKA